MEEWPLVWHRHLPRRARTTQVQAAIPPPPTRTVGALLAAGTATATTSAASSAASGTQLPEKTYPAGTFVYNGLDFGSVFNPEYYYNHNPDLQKAIGYDPQKLFQHFIQYGVAEGRAGIG